VAGQLIQRGPRTWYIRVFMGRVRGKRQYHNETVHGTKRDAQARLNKLLVDRDNDRLVTRSRLTLAEYLDKWTEQALRGRVAPRTYKTYSDNLTRYIIPELGHMRLTKIEPLDIQSVYTRMTARGLSAGTVRHAHTVIRNALAQAVKWRMLQTNPADFVDLPKTDRTQKFRALTREQVERFMAAIADSPWRAVYHLMLNTGMRPGEVFGLTWEHVNLAAGELVVAQAVTFGADRVPILSTPKTKKARRITFTQELAQVLAEHREATSSISNPLGLVFPNIEGELIHPNHWSKRDFKNAVKAAGLPDSVRLYDLRHSMATLALAAGIHPKVVSERLGHATTKLTLDTYSHVTPHMQAQAGAQLASLIYGSSGAGEEVPVN